MKRRLILHIGVHKTASSYLQRLFRINREYLGSVGLLYPVLKGNAHHSFSRELNFPTGARHEQAKLFDQIRRSDAKTILISSEGFDVCNPKQIEYLRDLADREDLEVNVIYFVRNQVDSIESGLRGTKRYERLLKERELLLKTSLDRSAFKLMELYRKWTDVFEQNVSVGVYENEPNIVEGFIRLSKLQNIVDCKKLRKVDERINPSMDVRFVLAAQKVLQNSSPARWDEFKELILPHMREKAIEYSSINGQERAVSYFSPEDRMLIVSKFERQNREFSNRVTPLPDAYFQPTRELSFTQQVDPEYLATLLAGSRLSET